MVTLAEQPTQQDTPGLLIYDETASGLYTMLEPLTRISSHVLPEFKQVQGLKISVQSCFLLT